MAFEPSLYRLKIAQGFLAESRQDVHLRRWRSAVDNAQLAVENAAKAALEPMGCARIGGRDIPWSDFLCRRECGRGRRAGKGCGFRIEFPEVVRGPVAVGYGAHFGMGGFESEYRL